MSRNYKGLQFYREKKILLLYTWWILINMINKATYTHENGCFPEIYYSKK